MTGARSNRSLAVWVALVAAALLLGLMLRAQPVGAPTVTLKQIVAAPAPGATSPSGATTQRTISKSGTTSLPNPPAPPAAVQQTAPQAPTGPGSSQCPAQPGSGLPCEQALGG